MLHWLLMNIVRKNSSIYAWKTVGVWRMNIFRKKHKSWNPYTSETSQEISPPGKSSRKLHHFSQLIQASQIARTHVFIQLGPHKRRVSFTIKIGARNKGAEYYSPNYNKFAVGRSGSLIQDLPTVMVLCGCWCRTNRDSDLGKEALSRNEIFWISNGGDLLGKSRKVKEGSNGPLTQAGLWKDFGSLTSWQVIILIDEKVWVADATALFPDIGNRTNFWCIHQIESYNW